jgi:hypothetical protein
MLVTQKYFLITVICSDGVEGHLTDNIRKFNPVNYTSERINTGKGGAEASPGYRIQILCNRELYFKVMSYLQQYYEKEYGIVYFMQEADVPM